MDDCAHRRTGNDQLELSLHRAEPRGAPGWNAPGYGDLMRVEIWSDVVCPWCYLGKRRFEAALARFDQADEIEVVWRSFELDPGAPELREVSSLEHLAQKYGMSEEQVHASWKQLTELGAAEGIEYHLDRARSGNSFDAHRLIHLGAAHGLGDETKEALLHAYFTDCEPIGDAAVLERVALAVGLPADEVRDLLAGDRFAAEVRADQQQARDYGIGGVPFFALDGRYTISGAQSTELMLEAIETAWAEHVPVEG